MICHSRTCTCRRNSSTAAITTAADRNGYLVSAARGPDAGSTSDSMDFVHPAPLLGATGPADRTRCRLSHLSRLRPA